MSGTYLYLTTLEGGGGLFIKTRDTLVEQNTLYFAREFLTENPGVVRGQSLTKWCFNV